MNTYRAGWKPVVRSAIRIVAGTAAALAAASLLAPAASASRPAAELQSQWVGVLPGANGVCPAQTEGGWFIFQDNADSNSKHGPNENGRGGWIGGITSNHNTQTNFCRVSSDRFAHLAKGDYRVNFAVLALSAGCPDGTVMFERYFDDEDNNAAGRSRMPDDSATRNTGSNTYFRFCWYITVDRDKPEAPQSALPDLGGSYGGYGQTDAGYVLDAGFVRTDDEDGNRNTNSISPVNTTLEPYRAMWITADRNTYLKTVRLK